MGISAKILAALAIIKCLFHVSDSRVLQARYPEENPYPISLGVDDIGEIQVDTLFDLPKDQRVTYTLMSGDVDVTRGLRLINRGDIFQNFSFDWSSRSKISFSKNLGKGLGLVVFDQELAVLLQPNQTSEVPWRKSLPLSQTLNKFEYCGDAMIRESTSELLMLCLAVYPSQKVWVLLRSYLNDTTGPFVMTNLTALAASTPHGFFLSREVNEPERLWISPKFNRSPVFSVVSCVHTSDEVSTQYFCSQDPIDLNKRGNFLYLRNLMVPPGTLGTSVLAVVRIENISSAVVLPCTIQGEQINCNYHPGTVVYRLAEAKSQVELLPGLKMLEVIPGQTMAYVKICNLQNWIPQGSWQLDCSQKQTSESILESAFWFATFHQDVLQILEYGRDRLTKATVTFTNLAATAAPPSINPEFSLLVDEWLIMLDEEKKLQYSLLSMYESLVRIPAGQMLGTFSKVSSKFSILASTEGNSSSAQSFVSFNIYRNPSSVITVSPRVNVSTRWPTVQNSSAQFPLLTNDLIGEGLVFDTSLATDNDMSVEVFYDSLVQVTIQGVSLNDSKFASVTFVSDYLFALGNDNKLTVAVCLHGFPGKIDCVEPVSTILPSDAPLSIVTTGVRKSGMPSAIMTNETHTLVCSLEKHKLEFVVLHRIVREPVLLVNNQSDVFAFIGENQEIVGYNLGRSTLVLAWTLSANMTDSGLLCPKKLYVAPTGHLAISSSCGKVHRLFLIDPNQPHTIFSEGKMEIPNTEEALICPTIGGLAALAVDESGRAKLWSGNSQSRELISNPIVPNMPPLNLVCPTGGSLFAAVLTNPRPAVAVYRAESRHRAGTRLHSLVVFSGEFVSVSRLGQRFMVVSRDYQDNFLVKAVFPDGPLVYVDVGDKEADVSGINFTLHVSTKLEGNAFVDLNYTIVVESNLSNSKAGPPGESGKATQANVSSWNEIELDRFGNFPAAALKIELESISGNKEPSYKLEPRIKKERVIDALVSTAPYFHIQSFGSTGLIAAKYYYGHLYVDVYVENRFIWRFVEPLNAAPKALTFSMTAPYRHDSRISAYLLMPPSGVIGEQLLHLRGSQGEFLIRRFVFPANGVRKLSAVGSLLILQGDTDILIADSEDTGMATARIPNVIEHFVHPLNDVILFVGISEDKFNIEFHNITIDQFSNKIIAKKVGSTSFGTRLSGIFGCRSLELLRNEGILACGFASVGVRIKSLFVDFRRDDATMVNKTCDLDLPLASEVLNIEVAASHVIALVQEKNPRPPVDQTDVSSLSVMIWRGFSLNTTIPKQLYSAVQLPQEILHPENKKLVAAWVSDNGASRVETQKIRNGEPSSASFAVITGTANESIRVYSTTKLNLKLICDGVQQKSTRVGSSFSFPDHINLSERMLVFTTPGGEQRIDISHYVDLNKKNEAPQSKFTIVKGLAIIGTLILLGGIVWLLLRGRPAKPARTGDSDLGLTLTTSRLD